MNSTTICKQLLVILFVAILFICWSVLLSRDSVRSNVESTESSSVKIFVKNSVERRLPKCLIIGFAKCGTYALVSFLSLHPDIVAAEHEIKYFSDHFDNGVEWYREQMPLSLESQITVEKTPNVNSRVLKRIHDFNATIKLIIAVRDPVIRLQSAYVHAGAVRARDRKETFEHWIQHRNVSVIYYDYAAYIADVYRMFSKNQVLVIDEKELEETPLSVMKAMQTFLGLRPVFSDDLLVFNRDKGFYCFNVTHPLYQEVKTSLRTNTTTGCFKAEKGRTHPEVTHSLLKKLAYEAAPYNEKLFSLIGKRFKWTNPRNL